MTDALVNLDAEQELLGAILSDNYHIDAAADRLGDGSFSLPLHERLFQLALSEVAKGNAANPATLFPYVKGDADLEQLGGPPYIARLTGANTLTPVPQLAKHIADLANRRRMRDGLSEASKACGDMGIAASEIIDAADAALSGEARNTIHQPTAAECINELLASYGDKPRGVLSKSIAPLDDVLGPICPKQLVIGAGRPGMGKTAVALSYSLAVAQQGAGVLFVSLEMSSTELAQRMAADVCFDDANPIPFNRIRDGRLSMAEKGRIGEAGRMLADLPMQIIDTGSLTIGRLNILVRRHARRMKAAGDELRLVVVDYLQLLQSDQRGRSNYETVSEVSKGLKAIAKDHGVGVLALAQLSREVEKRPDKRPQLSDLRDSGQIEQDADAVLFLLREEYYLRQDEPDVTSSNRAAWEELLEDASGKIEFIVAKRRNGTVGNAIGSFHGAYQAVRQ